MTLVTSTANPIWHFRRNTAGPRRIVHVPPRFASSTWAGTESMLLALARQQLGSGMEPIIITTMALSEIRHEIVSGVRVHRHPYSYYFFGSGEVEKQPLPAEGANLLAMPVFQSLMQEPEVRLFHTHALGRLAGEVRNAARMRFRPFVATVHDDAISSGTLSGSRKELEDADMVIFTDKAEADRAPVALGHHRIAHLPSGVDCARFATGDGASLRAMHGIPEDAFVIGHFSHPGAAKDQSVLLLDAFAQAAARRDGMHLVLRAPETQTGHAARLAEAIQQFHVEDRVHLLPPEEDADAFLADALHACDAIFASSRSDALEAWSASRPVITSYTDPFTTLIRDGETGLFFEPQSPLATLEIAAHIERLASNEPYRHQLGAQGRTEALARHDWSRISARLEEIYQLAEKNHQTSGHQGKKAA